MIDIATAIKFEESSHTYWLDGVRVPSITQTLKVAMYDEFEFVDPKLLALRAAEGTMLAAMVEWYEKRGDFSLSDFADTDAQYDMALDLLDDLDAYLQFKAATGFVTETSEQMVASRKYGFAGRLDLTGRFPDNDRLQIIDIKRTATPPRSGGPQTSAQEIGWRETFDVDDSVQIDRSLLHLRRGKYKLIPKTDRHDRALFLSCLNVTKWREK